MKKSKFYLLSGFLGLLVTTLAVSSLASADTLDGNFFRGRNMSASQLEQFEQFREERQAEQEAMEEAMTNGDYQAWKEIIESRPRITDTITENNFSKFVQMHNYMQSGDFEAAQAIHEELDLDEFGPGMGIHMGLHKGFRMGHKFQANK